MSEKVIVPFCPLEDLIIKAINDGSKHISIGVDKEGRYQGNVQKVGFATFAVHVSNDPVEALYGALGGVPGTKLWNEMKELRNGPVRVPGMQPPYLDEATRPVDDPADPHMTYWYHPESDSVWECMSNELPRDLGDGMSHQISEEEYNDFLDRDKAAAPAPVFHDPELDDLL